MSRFMIISVSISFLHQSTHCCDKWRCLLLLHMSEHFLFWESYVYQSLSDLEQICNAISDLTVFSNVLLCVSYIFNILARRCGKFLVKPLNSYIEISISAISEFNFANMKILILTWIESWKHILPFSLLLVLVLVFGLDRQLMKIEKFFVSL